MDNCPHCRCWDPDDSTSLIERFLRQWLARPCKFHGLLPKSVRLQCKSLASGHSLAASGATSGVAARPLIWTNPACLLEPSISTEAQGVRYRLRLVAVGSM